MTRKIVLASSSPIRVELLKNAGLKFDVLPSDYYEELSLKISPKKMVTLFATEKAKDVAKQLKSGVVIGADTVCYFNKKILGKPKSKDDAIETLMSMSGKWIFVYSGICIIDVDKKKQYVDFEISKIKLRKLSRKDVEKYVATGEPLNKAGSFTIQGLGSILIEKITGCYFNVMGLPLYKVYSLLKKCNVKIEEYWEK